MCVLDWEGVLEGSLFLSSVLANVGQEVESRLKIGLGPRFDHLKFGNNSGNFYSM